jgi:hypothetical protein
MIKERCMLNLAPCIMILREKEPDACTLKCSKIAKASKSKQVSRS